MQKAFYLIKKVLRDGWPLLIISGAFITHLNSSAIYRILPGFFSAIFFTTFVWLSPAAALLISYRYYKRGKGSITAINLAICCVLSIGSYWCYPLIQSLYPIYKQYGMLNILMYLIKTPFPSAILLLSHLALMVALINPLMAISIALCLIKLKKKSKTKLTQKICLLLIRPQARTKL